MTVDEIPGRPRDTLIDEVLVEAMDSMTQQIAVIDHRADIVWVNRAWIEFGERNGAADGIDWTEWNYLSAGCIAGRDLDDREGGGDDDDDLDPILRSLRDIIDGSVDEVTADYPCHSPTEERWFQVAMKALDSSHGRFVTVVHHDVTARHVAEQRALRLALRDPLTGVANRRHFDDFLEQQWRQAGRFSLPVSVIAVDVDEFKAVNDLWGHAVGDQVLADVAGALEEVCRRSTDLAARIGGDEFAAVLSGTDAETAGDLAESTRARVASMARDGEGVGVSVSIGVACLVADGVTPVGELTRAADRAMMSAKRAGRDRVVVVGVDGRATPLPRRGRGSVPGDAPRGRLAP